MKRRGMNRLKYGRPIINTSSWELGKYDNKHKVGIMLNKRWRKRIIDTEYINERAITTTILVNRQLIKLMSVYFHHSKYADYHIDVCQQIAACSSACALPVSRLGGVSLRVRFVLLCVFPPQSSLSVKNSTCIGSNDQPHIFTKRHKSFSCLQSGVNTFTPKCPVAGQTADKKPTDAAIENWISSTLDLIPCSAEPSMSCAQPRNQKGRALIQLYQAHNVHSFIK